ncbi:MAG: nucleotidyltransferase domain-containing protein [Candidatus Nanoarchaeia archaeon]|nr:nucleotidyltransferase domain-containing protein [Candidatus Nanoarchaeia archaeon]
MNIKEIKLELLDTIYSNLDEKKNKSINSFIKSLNNIILENNLPIFLKVGGSYAKQTFLGNDFDVDVFLRVKNDEKKNESFDDIITKFIEILKLKYLKINKIHGSRDYYQFVKDDVKYELVPNKYIDDLSQATNTTDYSPFHVDFLKKEMLKNKKLNDEIRITKMFLKACNCYGAESYINSFSGHSLDILVAYFKNFENTLEFLSKINISKKYLIDISDFYKNDFTKNIDFSISKEDYEKIKKQFDNKINSSLIIIDPIDKNRIASSALNNYRILKIKYYSKLFLETPSSFFFERNIKFKKKSNNIILKYEKNNENMDICGANVLSIKRKLSNFLKENDFEVLDNFDFTNFRFFKRVNKRKIDEFNSKHEDVFFDGNHFYLKIILKKNKISKYKIIKGPIFEMEENTKEEIKNSIESFKNSHKNTFIKNEENKYYIFAKEKREKRKLRFFIEDFFEKRKDIEKYVNRVK